MKDITFLNILSPKYRTPTFVFEDIYLISYIERLEYNINNFHIAIGGDLDFEETRVVAITSSTYPGDYLYKLVSTIKEKYKDIIVILYGPICDFYKEKLPEGVGYRIKNQVILKLPNLLSIIFNKDFDDSTLESLDCLHKTKVTAFVRYNEILCHGKEGQVLTSLGCNSKCLFCGFRKQYPKLLLRKPEYIVSEIQDQYIEKGYGEFNFINNNFCDSVDSLHYMYKIFELLDSIGLDSLKFISPIRPDTVVRLFKDSSLFRTMLKRFKRLHLGVESAEQVTLNYLKKGIKVETIQECMDILKGEGVEIFTSLMVGCEPDTEKSLDTLFEFIRKNKVIPAINTITPYPSTDLFIELQDKLLHKDFSLYNSRNLVFKHKHLTDELIKRRVKEFLKSYSPMLLRSWE